MAALATDFTGWRIVPGTGELALEFLSVTGTVTFFRGAIPQSAVASNQAKVSNGVTTDIPIGINEKRITTTAANTVMGPIWTRGVVWLTGVAAIAAASGLNLLFALSGSDNPADLTATAAGNSQAFGRIINIEVTTVSGYVDMTQRHIAETA